MTGVANLKRTEPEYSLIWTIRGVDRAVRHRMFVQAVTQNTTVGDLVEALCLKWLDDGAPVEDVKR